MGDLQTHAGTDLEDHMAFLTEECKTVPHLSERLLVDSINGLEVVDDQLRFKSKQSRFSRLLGTIDGSNRRRELIIQQTQQEMMRGMLTWVEELTHYSTVTTRALAATRQRLDKTRSDLLAVAKHSMENRQLIEQHAERIDAIESKIRDDIEKRLDVLDAKNNIDKTCRAWEAGRLLGGYPQIIQVAFAVDCLLRGKVGHIIIDQHEDYLYDSIVAVMARFGYKGDTAISIEDILENTIIANEDKRQVAAYLLDISNNTPLHKALSESTATGNLPAWVLEEKKIGNFHPSYRPRAFARSLQREAALLLEADNGDT